MYKGLGVSKPALKITNAPIDERTRFGAGCKYATKEDIPLNLRYKTLVTTDQSTLLKYGFDGLGLDDANWIEIVATTKDFIQPLQFSTDLNDALILAPFDYTINSETHIPNITDVRIGINVTPVAPQFPIEVKQGDNVNVSITATDSNITSAVNLICTKTS